MQYCKPNPDCPVDILIWVSRIYLTNLVEGRLSPEQMRAEVARYGADILLDPLSRIWDAVVASSRSAIPLHELDCPRLSFQEQSLIMALRCLQKSDQLACAAALGAVLPPATIRVLWPDVRSLARALVKLSDDDRRRQLHSEPGQRHGRPVLRIVH